MQLPVIFTPPVTFQELQDWVTNRLNPSSTISVKVWQIKKGLITDIIVNTKDD